MRSESGDGTGTGKGDRAVAVDDDFNCLTAHLDLTDSRNY